MTSYLIAIVMFPLPVAISKIFTNQIKCQKFYLENEGPCERGKNGTCCIELEKFHYILVIFSEFELSTNIHLQKKITHVHTHTHIYIYMCVYIYIYICVCVCIYICIYIHFHFIYIYIYIFKVSWCKVLLRAWLPSLLWKFGKNRLHNTGATPIFVNSDLDLHFQGQMIRHFLLLVTILSLWSKCG